MGQVSEILTQATVPRPIFNERGVVEVCENIHLHWRNFRLEFGRAEFLLFLDMIQSIDRADVENAIFEPDGYKTLAITNEIPAESEWDDRLVLERQADGTFHWHYRQLRVEVETVEEIGKVEGIIR